MNLGSHLASASPPERGRKQGSTMIRATFVTFVVLLSACGATTTTSPKTASRGEDCSRWEGESCTHDAQCCTLWCVNGDCARREP